MTKSEEDVKTITGDGLWLKMDSNNKVLKIIGDGCKITLTRNNGTIRVVGDGCQLKVIRNLGTIEYRGDGGRVDLGPDSSKDITFCGHGGHLKFLKEKSSRPCVNQGKEGREQEEEISSNLQENQGQEESEFVNDNQENERRERRKKMRTDSKKGSTVVVTKIVSGNGESKTSVRTFHNYVNQTRS